jgi:hypothetical protein
VFKTRAITKKQSQGGKEKYWVMVLPNERVDLEWKDCVESYVKRDFQENWSNVKFEKLIIINKMNNNKIKFDKSLLNYISRKSLIFCWAI